MAKPPPRRVPSDDCAVPIGGEIYHAHEGEWVEIVGSTTVAEMAAGLRFQQLATDLAAISGEPDEQRKVMEIMNPVFDEMCRLLALRLTAWSWTDDASRPLGPPNDVAVLKGLRSDELQYLLTVAISEGPGERKNGSSVSLTTSSATASPGTGAPRRTTGRRPTTTSSRRSA